MTMQTLLWLTCTLYFLYCQNHYAHAVRIPKRGLFDNPLQGFEGESPGAASTAMGHLTIPGLSTAFEHGEQPVLTASHTASGVSNTQVTSTAQQGTFSFHTHSIIGTIPPPPKASPNTEQLIPTTMMPAETESPNSITRSSSTTAGATLSTSPAELAQWKVLGVTVLCIGVVATIILSVVFFDSWWGFLRDVLLGRKRQDPSEELIPDWKKRSWEVGLVSEDGHRYPSLSSVKSLSKWKDSKVEEEDAPPNSAKQEDADSTRRQDELVMPTPTYLATYDPYKSCWLPNSNRP